MEVRTRLGLEELTPRTAPSVTPLDPPDLHPVTAVAHHPAPLSGSGHGWYAGSAVPAAEVGQTDRLRGRADIAGVGKVNVAGTIHQVGLVARGHAWGELTLANTRGSIVLELTGPDQAGSGPAPGAFTYRVAWATGAYRHLAGGGTVTVGLTPASDGPHGGLAVSFG